MTDRVEPIDLGVGLTLALTFWALWAAPFAVAAIRNRRGRDRG